MANNQGISPVNAGSGASSARLSGIAITGTPSDQQTLKYLKSQNALTWAYAYSPMYVAAVVVAATGFIGLINTLTSAMAFTFSKSGTEAPQNGTSTSPLRARFTSAAIAGSSAGMIAGTGGACSNRFCRAHHFSYVTVLQLANTRVWMGICDAGQSAASFRSDAPNIIFVGFRYSTSAGETTWQAIVQTGSGALSTKVDTGVTVDILEHNYEITYDDPTTTYKFRIDGILVASINTNVPNTVPNGTNGVFPLLEVDNIAAASAVAIQIGSMDGIGKTI